MHTDHYNQRSLEILKKSIGVFNISSTHFKKSPKQESTNSLLFDDLSLLFSLSIASLRRAE